MSDLLRHVQAEKKNSEKTKIFLHRNREGGPK